MYRYKLRWADGSDAGERECSSVVHPNEIIWIGGGRRLHVLEVMPARPGSQYAAMLRVERADGPPTDVTWVTIGRSDGTGVRPDVCSAASPTERKRMHARVTTISGSPDNADAGIANFRDNVVPYAKSEGKGALLLVDRESGKAIAVTLWADEEAMRASEESANALRADAAKQMGAGQQPTVERYEVAVFEV